MLCSDVLWRSKVIQHVQSVNSIGMVDRDFIAVLMKEVHKVL